MIIRFRSKDGMYRVNVDGEEDFERALERLVEKLPSTDPKQLKISTSPGEEGQPASALCGQTTNNLGLKHGDLLFATYPDSSSSSSNLDSSSDNKGQPTSQKSSETTGYLDTYYTVKQLPIDDKLEKLDGKIVRPKDKNMCRHGDKGMCDYCMPLEPYDQGYLEENSIKHASFHAHLKELNADRNKTGSASSYMAPLEEPDYSVNKNCPSGHAAWPEGICTKCQPSAITLQRQTFRMVDHVEFANPAIINTFIDSWRQSGTQRIGYLYGRYEQYDRIPLGIKAVVEAVFEPAQHDETDGLRLTLPWEEESTVDKLAQLCGLQKVGVIYTDLTDAGKGDGSVLCKRHVDSYFLSSLEIAFAAQLQVQNPNTSRWSNTGKYSSKFVTCVITGNQNGEIDISSYQASISAEAMVKADLIEPSANPSYMRIKEPSSTRYVPEIFYKRINEYKRAVNENAKPAFPVEYLLLTLTHGFPDDPKPLFKSEPGKFPIENRQFLGTLQDLGVLGKHLGLDSDNVTLAAVSDFHLLAYVSTLGVLSSEEQQLLVNAALSGDVQDGYKLLQSSGWQTLLTIIKEST